MSESATRGELRRANDGTIADRELAAMSEHLYDHPTLGRFTRTKYGDYVRRVQVGDRIIPLTLHCGHEPPESRVQCARACSPVAERVHAKLAAFVEAAADLAAKRCLPIVNQLRAAEEKPPMTRDEYRAVLRLFDVHVERDGGSVAFTGTAYRDDRRLAIVRFGPRGGLKDANIE